MGTLSNLTGMARAALNRMAVARRRRQTARLIESLPPQILKDIGYGEHFSDVNNFR